MGVMAKNINREGMSERFKHLQAVISGQRFLSKQGLGNEIPFFICPFNPKEAAAMDRARQGLIKSLGSQGVEVLDINLYDLTIELLKGREIWEQILVMEETVPKEQLKELLQGVLDPEAHVCARSLKRSLIKKPLPGSMCFLYPALGRYSHTSDLTMC